MYYSITISNLEQKNLVLSPCIIRKKSEKPIKVANKKWTLLIKSTQSSKYLKKLYK